MKTTQRILAVVAAVAIVAVALFSAQMTHSMRFLFADLGCTVSDPVCRTLLSIPGWAFIGAGAVFAVASADMLWRLRRAWLSIPICLVLAVLAALYLAVFAGSVLQSVAALHSQVEAADAAPAVTTPGTSDGVER